jgi:hypothetical protein
MKMTWTNIRRSGARRTRLGERGIALAMALFFMALLALAFSESTLIASADIRATRNYRGASAVHFVAESALSEAVQRLNAVGIVDFRNDVVGQWPSTWGPARHGFGPLPGYTYTVTPVPSAAGPAVGRLVAIADGPEGEHNVTVANVVRSNIPSAAPGAIYLATDTSTSTQFQGGILMVSGIDHDCAGGPGSASPVPGISTRNDGNTQSTINSLDASQKAAVQGLGFSLLPAVVPSVSTSPAAPSMAQVGRLVDDLLGRPGVVTNDLSEIDGNVTFGTTSAPEITHFTGSDGVTLNGDASGAGIAIVDGDLTIQGTLNFEGLVLARGRTKVRSEISLSSALGNGTICGSLWTRDVDLDAGSSLVVSYSTQALGLANQVGGGGALPAPVQVTALADCAVLPAATGGCP